MSYTLMSPQPAQRAADAVGVSAPGLYPEEVAVTLDTGDDVAVYVDASPTDNNAGIAFYGSARCINADGSTKMFQNAVELVTECQHSSPATELTAYGAQPLGNQLLLAVLGEPLTQVAIPNAEPAPAPQTQAMIPWDPVFLANVSIRTMIAAANASAAISAAAGPSMTAAAAQASATKAL